MKASNQHEFRVVPAGEFKATCLRLMEEINEKPLTIIMTKRGRPVAQMSAPPPGLKLSRPSVEMVRDEVAIPLVSRVMGSALFEPKHRKSKRGKKKKKKD